MRRSFAPCRTSAFDVVVAIFTQLTAWIELMRQENTTKEEKWATL